MSNNFSFIAQLNSFNCPKYFSQKEKKFLKVITNEIKNEYEILDKQIQNSLFRKKLGFIIKGYTPRTIITIFGKITFVRTKYQYYDKNLKRNRTIHLLDKHINIISYQRINLDLRTKIINQLISGKTQKAIVQQYKNSGITRASVSSIIKKLNTKILMEKALIKYQVPNNIKDKQHIYINVDDTFIALRKNKKREIYRIRLIVTHLGYNTFNKNYQKRLLHKRAFYLIEKSPYPKNNPDLLKKLAKQVHSQLNFFYGEIKHKELIVCGDGALWIQELANHLNADYVLDKFHIANLFYRSLSHNKNSKVKNKASYLNKEIYQTCSQMINQGNSQALVDYLDMIKKNFRLMNLKKQKIEKLIGYVNNHYNGIENYKQPYYIGSQTEAMVSHLVKSIKGYGSKIYNYQTFINLLNFKFSKVNELKINNVYYQEAIINNKKNYPSYLKLSSKL